MFKFFNIKKLFIAIASIAMVSSIGVMPVSAKRYHHIRPTIHTTRVYNHKHVTRYHSAKYYIKSWHYAKKHHISYHRWINAALHVNKQNFLFKKGFNNALHAHVTAKYIHNENYSKGFILALVANNNNFHFTKTAFKLGALQYKGTIISGNIDE